MPTKYILHGGNAQELNDDNTLFFQEILKTSNDEVNVLLVQLAAVPEKQEVYKQIHTSQFERAKGFKTLKFQVAELATLEEQLQWADVVYFGGSSGGTVRLLNIFSKLENLKEKFDGKIIAGESAGANFLSAYCLSKSGGVLPCLGIVPVNLITHYELGDELQMATINNNLELLELKNYEYRTLII